MYVLHLSRTTLAGVAARYANFLNKYSQNITARSAVSVLTNIKFPTDIVIPSHTVPSPKYKNVKIHIVHESEELCEEIKKADIIHIHNKPPCEHKSQAWGLMKKKPIVLQLHSPPNISKNAHRTVRSHLDVSKTLVIAQYQAVHLPYDNMIPVRNVIDIQAPLLMPIIKEHNPPFVTYAPSNQMQNRIKAGWAYKSFKEVIPLLKQLAKQNSCTIDIKKRQYQESLRIRRPANIHIDEVSSGSYHLSSLEGLSQGSIVIANIADWMEPVIKKVTGCEWLPWQTATEPTLTQVLHKLLSEKDKLLELQKISRQWMEEFWNPELVLNDYKSIYEDL